MKKVIVKIEARIPIQIPPNENIDKFINDEIKNIYMINDYKVIGINYNPSNFPKIDLRALEMLK